jgi:ABC-type transport system substrate-binding protein
MWLGLETCFQETQANQLDIGCLPPGEVVGVAQQYGVSRSKPVGTGRFWVKATSCEASLLLNHRRSLFAGNTPLRQAVNWAVDRTAIAGRFAPYAATPWTHLLPPGSPGSITAPGRQPYAGAPNLSKARRLAAGHIRPGTVNVGYRSSSSSGLAQAQLVRSALTAIGFKDGDVKLKGFSGADLYDAMGKHNTDLDLGVGLGVCSDYPSPFGPFGVVGLNASYRAKLAAAERLHGAARLRALGELDLAITNTLAPVVVMRTYDNRYLFSGRVKPRSLVYQSAYQDWSIPALALK